MSNPNAPTIERIVLAFQQAYFEDDSKDGAKSLSHYLKLWPDHEDLIAREFLNLQNGIVESVEMHDLDADSKTLGPYALDREIGRGGQGVVYKATDSRLGRVVALKVLTGLGPGAEKQIIRFRREAEVAARLDHPGICGVHDAGVEDGVPYIAMRYVSGESLAQRLSRSKATSNRDNGESIGFLDLTEMGTDGDGEEIHPQVESTTDVSMTKSQFDATLRVFEKAARALHAAHEAGVIHRDVKPGNIMVTDEGEPVVLDFGLAHDDSEDMPSLTQTGDFFGTPAYMSPEQIAGQRIHLDARSDVYSLGVTLYESLVLRRPFDSPTREGLYQAIMTKDAPDPRRLNRSISKDLKIVLECVLEKDRDKRYQSALAFADDLAAVRELRPIAANPIGPVGRIARWAKRKPVRATFVAALIIGIPLITGLSGYIVANLPNIQAQEQALLDEATEQDLERGFFELASTKDFRASVSSFESALERSPGSAGAATGLALAFLKLREPQSALEVLDSVESKLPDRTLLYSLKADVLEKLDRIPEAKELRKSAKPPRSALAYFVEGHRLQAQHHVRPWHPKAVREQIAKMFSRAVVASPKARRAYHLSLARSIGRDAGLEECSAVAEAIENLWPDEFHSLMAISFCLENHDSKREFAALEAAFKLKPDHLHVNGWMGIALANRGRHKEAKPFVRKAIDLGTKDANYFHIYIFCLLGLEEFDDAATWCRKGLELEDRNYDYYFYSTLNNLLRRDDNESVREYLRTTQIGFEKKVSLNALTTAQYGHFGLFLLAGRKVDEGIKYLTKSINSGSPNPEFFERLVSCLRGAARYKESLRICVKGLAITGQSKSIFLTKYRVMNLVSLGQKEEALRHFLLLERDFKNTVGDSSKNYVRIGNYGVLLANFGREKEAIPHLKRAIALGSRHPGFYKKLGDCLVSTGQWQAAIANCHDGLELEDQERRSFFLSELSFLYSAHGPTDKAREFTARAESEYRKKIKENRADPKGHGNLASFLSATGQIEKSIVARKVAIGLATTNSSYHNSLGCAYLAIGELELAEASFREAIKHEEDGPFPNMNLGYIHHLRGEQAKAERCFAITLQSKLDMMDVEKTRVRKWIRGDKPKNRYNDFWAHKQASYIVRMTKGKDAVSLDLLSTVEFLQGKFDEAVKHQRELLTLMSGKDVGELKVADAEAKLAKYKNAMVGEDAK